MYLFSFLYSYIYSAQLTLHSLPNNEANRKSAYFNYWLRMSELALNVGKEVLVKWFWYIKI